MDLYKKNLSALSNVNKLITSKLKKLKKNTHFEVYQGAQETALNIFDLSHRETLYENPVNFFEEHTKDLLRFKEYPYLYYFGIGNGLSIKFLLQNRQLNRLLLIEPEIELLFIAFHFSDFSEDIKDSRLMIFLPEQITFATMTNLIGVDKSRFYVKTYTFFIQSNYYEKFHSQTIVKANEVLTKSLLHVIYITGNDVTDTLMGLEHHFEHIPMMLKNGKYHSLLNQKNSDVAVVVSTGPSLHKQLSLLKSIEKNVTIFSADASLPILEKNGIKPDFVTSIERGELTSIFFKKTSKEFQKDIIFVSASLQHTKTLKAIQGQKVLVMRPFYHNEYLGFHEYGYLGAGMSTSNLAHELALAMGYKTCILIGQDLAFAPNGLSHTKDHVLGTDNVKVKDSTIIKLKAYGGKGEVDSETPWMLFKNYFEQTIELTQHRTLTINATEGGARIEGSLEMPFKKAIQKHVNQALIKQPIYVQKATKKEFNINMNKAFEKIEKLIVNGTILLKTIENSFSTIFEACEPLEHKSMEEATKLWDISKTIELLTTIESTRSFLQNNETFEKFFYDIAQSNLLLLEIELAKIKVTYIDNPQDNQIKAIEWIVAHKKWFFTVAGIIQTTLEILEKAKKEWKN